jgi:hypothetical protein
MVRAFRVSLLLAVHNDQIGLDTAIRRQGNRTVAQPLAGLDSLGEVYFLAWAFATDDTSDSTRNLCRYHQLAR